VAFLSGVLALFSGEVVKPITPINLSSVVATIISGILCSGGAYYLQAYAQKEISTIKAGVLYSLIPLFSAIVSWMVLGNTLNGIEFIGSIIIVLALINININIPGLIKFREKGA
jgi:drug/metabolite transporter (DMT)-like permease